MLLLICVGVAVVFVLPLLNTLWEELFFPSPHKRREPTRRWSWKPSDLVDPAQWSSSPETGRWRYTLMVYAILLAVVVSAILRRW